MCTNPWPEINAFQNSPRVWMCDLVEVITQRDEFVVLKKTKYPDAMSASTTLLRCGQQQLWSIDFEHCVINKLPYGMLLNSNLI